VGAFFKSNSAQGIANIFLTETTYVTFCSWTFV